MFYVDNRWPTPLYFLVICCLLRPIYRTYKVLTQPQLSGEDAVGNPTKLQFVFAWPWANQGINKKKAEWRMSMLRSKETMSSGY
jgi:hypothetical protein